LVLKDVKTQLKSPLGDRHPAALLRYRALGRAGDEFILEDPNGERLVLADDGYDGDPATLPFPNTGRMAQEFEVSRKTIKTGFGVDEGALGFANRV
jgi:hypothetical protein